MAHRTNTSTGVFPFPGATTHPKYWGSGEKYARSQREKEGSAAMNIEQTELISKADIWNPVVRYRSMEEINKILIICHIQIYSELDYPKM